MVTIWGDIDIQKLNLPIPASPQNSLYGRHIESELGIDVMTI
jgi:hypothetical protein